MSKTSNSFDTNYSLNKIDEKNPIVFIHGVGLNQDIWKPQINFFKDYTTLTYDLLGHGKTPLSKSKVNFNDFSKQYMVFFSAFLCLSRETLASTMFIFDIYLS